MCDLTLSQAVRLYREQLLKDPFRPGYHFTMPDSNGVPGDPNGFFFAQGRYHLMYLYENADGAFHWGHVSSLDLLHWRHHADALGPLPGDGGCFSGGAFVDDDETAWLSYWIFNDQQKDSVQGIGLARAMPPYEHWERLPNAVIPSDEWGVCHGANGTPLRCADPSNIWKKDGIYYMQTGNKMVLDGYGRETDSPKHLRGDWTELFKSKDLLHWQHCGRFYQRNQDWTLDSEDDMCPSFLPLPNQPANGQLTDTMLQLFISHNMGCQYYTGTLDGERFQPQTHGRMSWVDDTFFAPEAALDDRHRHIMFAWLRDDLPDQFRQRGWCGTYGLPRQLWVDGQGRLCMQPLEELQTLRVRPLPCSAQGTIQIPVPLSFELQAVCLPGKPFHLEVLCRKDGACVEIGYDLETAVLYVDTTRSGSVQRTVRECAPLSLAPDEPLQVTVYVDYSVVEVFANQRQAITRRIYNAAPVEPLLRLEGAHQVQLWEMAASMPY